MKAKIYIPIQSGASIKDYLGNDFDESGRITLQGNPEVVVQIVPRPSRHAFPDKEVITLVVEFVSSVAAQMIAQWLYDKLKGRAKTLIIEKKEVAVDNVQAVKNAIEAEAKAENNQTNKSA